MSTMLADRVPNPYASPGLERTPAPAPTKPTTAVGSLAMVFGGFILVLAGYFTSNLFLIGDLYKIGMGPEGKPIASPFALLGTTPVEQWLLYALCASAFIAGAVMIGSQRFNPMAVVCYVMCPLVGAIYLVGSPLRIAPKKYAEIVAAVYLLGGSCLAFTGVTRLFLLYGRTGQEMAPILASMMTEVGLALILGAIVKFWCAASPEASREAAPVAATAIDALAARS
jgi:hypothetical protein